MKKMGITGKFTSVIVVFVMTLGVVFTAGQYGVSKVIQQSDDVLDNAVARRYAATRVVSNVKSAAVSLRDLLLVTEDARNIEINKTIEINISTADEGFDAIRKLETNETKSVIESAYESYTQWKSSLPKVRELALANKKTEAFIVLEATALKHSKAMNKSLAELGDMTTTEMKTAREKSQSLAVEMRNLMVIISALGLIIGITLAVLVIRSISTAVNRTIDTLNDTANQVASAAAQVSTSSQSLSQAATEQASSLEETSSAVEEMNSMIGRNSESAKESTIVANKGVLAAGRGQVVVENMLRSMHEIDNANKNVMRQTNESNAKIAEIVAVINEIGNKTKVINEIVFQTKLLSFNASVEAARAGEHGKGFAVVAEEVGKLAQMSGNAAKDITNLLEGSISKVQTIVTDSKTKIEEIVNENAKKVAAGSKIAEECRDVLSEIAKGITDVSQMAQSISGASDEQARGINEINRAIIQLDQVTQVNAATSEESASASEELSAQAEHMKGAVQGLIEIVRGENAVNQTIPMRRDMAVVEKKSSARSKPSDKAPAAVIHMSRSKPNQPPVLSRSVVGSDIMPMEDDERFQEI